MQDSPIRVARMLSLKLFVVALLLLVSALPVEAANIWTLTGSLSAARAEHTSTLLEDGNVLVVGGRGPLASAEIYDTAAGTFSTSADSLATARENHTATRLADGRVLIVGGVTGTSVELDSAEIYDPSTDTFTGVIDTMSTPRIGHSATLLTDGTVLIAGGSNGSGQLSSAEIFDPATATFTATTGAMAFTQYFHQATLLTSGKVLLTGGYHPASSGGGGRSEAQLYDPATGTFAATLNNMAIGHNVHTATLLADGTVLVAGGFLGFESLVETDLYDPTTNMFTAGPDMTAARLSQSATMLPDGAVLIAGGTDYATVAALTSSERFDPAAVSFATDATLNVARSGHTATALSDGRVLVIGGVSSGSELDSAEIYGSDCPDVSELEAELALANARISELEAQQIRTQRDLRGIVKRIQATLGHAGFRIPGRGPVVQLQNVATAIENLNHGQKKALYENLQDTRP